VGPIALLDEIGIDVASKVAHVLLDAFGARLKPPELTQKLIDDGRLGRKTRRGFYQYSNDLERGKKSVDPSVYGLLGVTPNREMPAEAIAERCVLGLVNESMRCLDAGVLSTPRDADVVAIFGLGVPPYLGAPLRYVETLGAAEVVRRHERLRDQQWERFEPAVGFEQLARTGRKLYY